MKEPGQSESTANLETHNTPEIVRLRRRIMQLETEVLDLRQALNREREHASTDPLTGIPNRRAYQQRLEEERARCRRENTNITLIVWDIDHFKSINDRFGHAVGDQVLKCIAQKLRQRLRQNDFLARIGGEEFVAILTDTTASGAKLAAEALREAVGDCLIENGDDRLQITISCGIAELKQTEDELSLFKRADAALYQAKQKGRNRVCLA